MTRTISRTRLQRGTQPTRTRDVIPGDAVAPRRRRLSANGPTEPVRAIESERAADVKTRGRRTVAPTDEVAESPPPRRRRRGNTAAIGAVEPGRDGPAASLEATNVRGPTTGGPAARERSKISRIRDGRYGRSRSRFIV